MAGSGTTISSTTVITAVGTRSWLGPSGDAVLEAVEEAATDYNISWRMRTR
jgi:hypothetical protein